MRSSTCGDAACVSRTSVARVNPAIRGTVLQRPPGSLEVVRTWVRLVSRRFRPTWSPHTPGLEALTRQTGPLAPVRVVVAAARPVTGSSEATRTTQQRRPPFSRNPRTASAR